jgi:hypothetical protein
VRQYAEQYGSDVVGVVLVDPTHEDDINYNLRARRWVRLRDLATGRAVPQPRREGRVSTQYNPEEDYLAEEFQQIFLSRRANPEPLGNRPLIVLGAGKRPQAPGTSEEFWKDLRRQRDERVRDLARLSRNSKFILDPSSSHRIHGDNPQLVARAIEEVVEAASKRILLKPSLVAGRTAMAQEKTIMPDLKALAGGKGGTVPADATLKWVEDAKGKPALEVQSKKDDTVILLDRIEFTDGVIEFDALGQSGPAGSNFLGFAFRVVDAKTHDAVYFRPFNFRAEDTERKAHAVQYVSHPKYRWQVLRKDKPGQYEKPIVPAPDGDAWFHVRIVVQKPKVSVYVNDGKEPSLVVEELSDRKAGGVGLWVGPGQGGYLANVKITPSK